MRPSLSMGGGRRGCGHKKETLGQASAENARVSQVACTTVRLLDMRRQQGIRNPALSASFVTLSSLPISSTTSVGSTIWESLFHKSSFQATRPSRWPSQPSFSRTGYTASQ